MSTVRFSGGELETSAGELVSVRGRGAARVSRALATFRKWSGREAEKVVVEETSPGTPDVLVELGELSGVQYKSDKWDGKRREYLHETESPRPRLCCDPEGRRLYIVGGGIRVRPEGLVG